MRLAKDSPQDFPRSIPRKQHHKTKLPWRRSLWAFGLRIEAAGVGASINTDENKTEQLGYEREGSRMACRPGPDSTHGGHDNQCHQITIRVRSGGGVHGSDCSADA